MATWFKKSYKPTIEELPEVLREILLEVRQENRSIDLGALEGKVDQLRVLGGRLDQMGERADALKEERKVATLLMEAEREEEKRAG